MTKPLFAVLVLVLAMAACGPEESRQAPPLVLPDLAGKTVDLAALRGKPVLLDFWATWCDTCVEEMPEIEALYRRSGGKYSLVTVSLDEDAAKAVPPFVARRRLTFPVLVADRKTVAAYAVRGLPTAFLIDAEGRVARRWAGRLDARAVENDIVDLLNRRTQ